MGVERHRRRSLAQKYTVFTVLLLVWAAVVQIGFRIRHGITDHGSTGGIDWWEIAVMAVGAPVVGAMISRFTHRVLAKPLALLEEGIARVREGALEPVPVSRTGDEIEYLGENLNAMIEAIAESRRQVAEHQELLEERIRQRTEALEEATGRALAASKAKSEFLANVSHELRTPMNGVLGMMDIVLDSDLPAGQREQIETAKNCAQTLLALLNDLLDLSKIEAGRMHLESIPFPMREVVEGCVLAVTPKAMEKGVAVRTSIAPTVPPVVVGDPLRVRQILMNLLSNAVKFTDDGSVEVEVATGKRTAGQLVLHLSVRDTGPGIPADKVSAIFDEFTQVDGSVSRRFGGTGLGLAITQRLVELHEGSIRVESEMGKGSRFLVDLVVGQAAVTSSRPAFGAPAEAVGSGSRMEEEGRAPDTRKVENGFGDRILVVEDNAVNQKVVNAVLVKHGFEVDCAMNGGEALKALEAKVYDLVLMDIQMPVMDGLTAARHIRGQSKWKDLPIVAMTAHAMRGDRERCLQAGMDDYLAKPVSPAHLVDTVRANLRRVRNGSGPLPIDQVPAVAAPLLVPAAAQCKELPPSSESAEPLPIAEVPPPVVAPLEAARISTPPAPEYTPVAETVAIRPPASPLPAPPIDAEEAARLMGTDEHLRTGMTLLFLQLAPERLAKLQSAALRGDMLTVRGQALKLQTAAERIAATETARMAAGIAAIAPDADTTRIAEELARLEAEVARLDEYMRPEREAFEEAAMLALG